MEETVPAAFTHFYQGPLFDRLLHGLILYFCSTFQHEILSRFLERSRKQHAEGFNPSLVSSRLHELEEQKAAHKMSLSQPYCEIIMKHSSYKQPQKDKQFFEALYSSLAAVLDEAFERTGKQAVIHQELDRLFRGRHFNTAARANGPQRSVDSLTVTQLWSLKHETENKSLHAKLISGLYEKPATLGVQVAVVSNTPLVSQAVASPMVSRSLLADPLERDALLNLPYSRKKKTAAETSTTQQPNSMFKQPAAGGTSKEAPQAAGSTFSSPQAAAPGRLAVTVPPGPRSSTLKPLQGTVASLPEAAGLPYDDIYAYLCLLRRAMLYGPTLGLATAPTPLGHQGSMTGVALAALAGQQGMLSTSSSTMLV